MRATFQKFAPKLREKYHQHHRKAAKMSQKAGISGSQPRKRKTEEAMRGKTGRPKKRIRKQTQYHSSSDESEPTSEGGFAPVNLLESDGEEEVSRDTTRGKGPQKHDAESEVSGASDDPESGESQSEDGEGIDHGFSSANRTQRKASTKRNDPEAFSTSISKILSTKLSQSARKDPVLTRSKEAVQISNDIANERLEKRARAKLRADRKEDLERGRVKDVLGLTTGDAGQTAEEEKRLRRIAQKGVVKLFNAVRAAQLKGEEAARKARKEGTVGFANREDMVDELGKRAFLELINGKKKGKPIEEG
jgi:Rrp15p